jgi:hypothetical protein
MNISAVITKWKAGLPVFVGTFFAIYVAVYIKSSLLLLILLKTKQNVTCTILPNGHKYVIPTYCQQMLPDYCAAHEETVCRISVYLGNFWLTLGALRACSIYAFLLLLKLRISSNVLCNMFGLQYLTNQTH